MVTLRDYQVDAINRMHNGSILCGGVGSGKSLTAIGYYFIKIGNGLVDGTRYGFDDDYVPMSESVDLYIITTARKRDTKEWESELTKYLISPDEETNLYSGNMKVKVDSWNNIGKYKDVTDSFFIFDEQRVVGYGAWTKAFLKIVKKNDWVLLSATPADTYMDFIPVFIANGFYRNKTDFCDQHVIWSRFSKFPQVKGYMREGVLIRHIKDIRLIAGAILFIIITVFIIPNIHFENTTLELQRLKLELLLSGSTLRTTQLFDVTFEHWLISRHRLFGYGAGYTDFILLDDIAGSLSIKRVLIDHGIVGFILIYVPLFWFSIRACNGNKLSIAYTICYFLSLYQRPNWYSVLFILLLFSGIGYIREKIGSL